MKYFYAVFIFLLLSGCVVNYDKTSSGKISNYSKNQVESMVIDGVTTKKDLLLTFGPPNVPDDYNHGNQWLYHSKIIDNKTLLFIKTYHNREQWLEIEFSVNNIVLKHSYRESP